MCFALSCCQAGFEDGPWGSLSHSCAQEGAGAGPSTLALGASCREIFTQHLAAMHQSFQSKVAPKSDPHEDGLGFPASTEMKTLLLFLLCFVDFMF